MIESEVLELRDVVDERELDHPDRTVALLADNDLGDTCLLYTSDAADEE